MKVKLLLCTVLAILISCNSQDDDNEKFSDNAEIGFVGWMDCDYVIQLENNEYYFADNLPEEFKRDNLKVSIQYTKTDKHQNCDFAGAVEIINIINIIETTD